ncbi:MAG: hypothetical protein LBC02_03300 [Planctomycetaceae bacterium]|nr:hypothetical protein [Planctomycetaceae bacterium]
MNANDQDTHITVNTKDGDVRISGIATNPQNTGGGGASIVTTNGNDSLTIKGANKHTNKGQEFTVADVNTIRWETDAEYVLGSGFLTLNEATLHQVETGKTVNGGYVTTLGGNYSFGSAVDNNNAGTFVLDTLAVTGNATVNNGLLAMNGRGLNIITGNLTIGNNNAAAQAPAAVALYGNIAPGIWQKSLPIFFGVAFHFRNC